MVGVSPDPAEAQKQFREKYDLPFTFLSDESTEVAQKYGVWQERERNGVKSMGIARTTFIVGANGIIQKAFANVQVDGHTEQVLGAL